MKVKPYQQDLPSNNQSQEVMSMKVQQLILKYIESIKTFLEIYYIPVTFVSVKDKVIVTGDDGNMYAYMLGLKQDRVKSKHLNLTKKIKSKSGLRLQEETLKSNIDECKV